MKRLMSSKFFPNLHYVSFVPATSVGTLSNTSENAEKSSITGREAQLFYNEVISGPSSVVPVNSKRNFNVSVRKKNPERSTYSCSRLTLFHYAQNGDVEGIKYLIDRGCDINSTDIFGWTPLMCAAAQNQIESAEYLLKKGASLSIKNKQEQTALDVAVIKNHVTMIKLLRDGPNDETLESIETNEEIKICEVCKCSFKESIISHQSSIAHLLCSEKKETSTFYHLPENNKGFKIMLKKGWDKNKGLGPGSNGVKFPVKTVLKSDRTGLGKKKEKAKITHFGPFDYDSVKMQSKPWKINKKTYSKQTFQKRLRENRQKEINFRRQFNID